MYNVIMYEANSTKPKHSFCFSGVYQSPYLQFQEEILKQLQAERNQAIGNYQFYYDEMEKIHENTYDGATHILTEASTELDTFFGSLGLPLEDNYEVQETNRRQYGIC